MAADDRLLVGFEHAEDAAVLRLDADRAVVVTIDVITPLVDDPFLFGEIAASNALSDLYAMGADGLLSLSFLGVPPEVPADMATEIARGGATLAKMSSAPVVGGHSVESKDVMFGLASVGLVHPEQLFRNDELEPNDALILTKPLGTGGLTTALKEDALTLTDVSVAVEGMRQTNRGAVSVCHAHEVCAATDVSGFGLVGHAAEMARASGVRIVMDAASVPAYPDAREMLAKGFVTRGDRRNPAYARTLGPVIGTVEPLYADPQTSGGLLVAVRAEKVDSLIAALREAGYAAATKVGDVVPGIGVEIR